MNNLVKTKTKLVKRKLVFATNNAHKLEEVAAILGDQVELLSLNDISCQTDIPETAETLEGNALLKSSYIGNPERRKSSPYDADS